MASLIRVFKFALQDIARNAGLSFMTVFILILMLLSVNTLLIMDVTTNEAVTLVKNQINVSFYLNSDTDSSTVQQMQSYISTFPEVTGVQVLSADDVLSAFKDRHETNQDVLDALSEIGGNPFGPTIVVKTKEPGDYTQILDAMNVPQYTSVIEGKSFEGDENSLNKLQSITNHIEQIGAGLSLLFAIIAFLIIFNTIRVAIQTQRVEISIKRLVGANNWFIRGPYLLESILFTVVSVAIAMTVVFFSVRWFDTYLAVIFTGGFSLTKYYESHMLSLFGIQIIAVLLLTVCSSTLAMRRQLKV